MADSARNLLVVEGPDDVHVIGALLREWDLTTLRKPENKGVSPLQLEYLSGGKKCSLDICPKNNVDRAIRYFFVELQVSKEKHDAIGLIVDNDVPITNDRTEQIQGKIARLKDEPWITLPDQFPQNEGTVVRPPGDSTYGFWLMPNNQDHGMLETFLQELIPDEQAIVWKYAQETTAIAKEKKGAKYKDCHSDKAKVHTYLAWQEESGKPFGIALNTGAFDPKAEAAKPLLQWICRLFEIDNDL